VTRQRFSVEQIVAVLKQAEMGAPVAELIRHLGIAEHTFYRWKRRGRPCPRGVLMRQRNHDLRRGNHSCQASAIRPLLPSGILLRLLG
jgi:putative transposase